jgi:hypothetical protein
LRIQGLGFRDLGFRGSGFGFRVSDSELRVQDFGFGVWGLEFRV